MKRAIRIDAKDNVATAVEALAPGESVQVSGAGVPFTLVVSEAIPQGHKLALVALTEGEAVVKYGETIGRATAAIAPGDHVHSHNVTGLRGRSA